MKRYLTKYPHQKEKKEELRYCTYYYSFLCVNESKKLS